ncbi:MAG: sulfotransferase [Deltaproteobacteria bacterium]|nr:sulfotransferase [Deltaproteobacteria bacterium]
MLPNFIFIGPAKSGSTWLYEALRLHPDVYVPEAKDIYFFDKNFEKGMEWYEGFFKHGAGKKAVGEVCHDYLFSADACERIKRHIPEVKLITCLRSPVERSFSGYLFAVRQGHAGRGVSLEDTVKKYPGILKNSCYTEALGRYITAFGRSRILILRFEDLEKDPLAFIARVYGFIGVDPGFRPVGILNRKILPASRPRVRVLARLAKKTALWLRAMGFANLVGTVKRSPAVQGVLYTPIEGEGRPRMAAKEKAFLRDYFKDEISSLERLLGEDLSAWRA